jgi:hypothetical protein
MTTVLSICRATRELVRCLIMKATHVGLWCTELELNNGNFGLFYSGWAPSGYDDILVQNDTFNKLCIFNRPPDPSDNADVPQIKVSRGWRYKTSYGIDSDGSERRRVVRYNLQRRQPGNIPCIETWDTLELRDVLAARKRLDLSFKSTGIEISARYSTAFAEAFVNDSAMVVGWMPF